MLDLFALLLANTQKTLGMVGCLDPTEKRHESVMGVLVVQTQNPRPWNDWVL